MGGGMGGGGFGGSFSSGASMSPPTSTMPYGNAPTANMVGSISTPPISGGPSVLQPNSNYTPDTGPIDPYRNPFSMSGFSPQESQPDFMKSALGYFGETSDTITNTGMSRSTPMTPELMVQSAQSRLAQRDIKSKPVMDYLNNVIQTGGNPTMMAPDIPRTRIALNNPAGGSFNSGGGMGGGGFSSPGFTTNTTSGGLVPGGLKSVSPPPDANVSDFFSEF